MMQFYTSATGAAKAARYFTHLLRRPVTRYMAVSKYGAPLWVVSLESSPYNSTQELTV